MRMFDSGERFGRQPIGTTGVDESAPRMDTERHKMPGLATKGSVFSWVPSFTDLMARNATAAGWTETINLRANTASSGSSVDVPTWAAGCVVAFVTTVSVMGAGI